VVLFDGPDLEHFLSRVEVGSQNVVLVVDQVDGQGGVHVVLDGVELHFAGSSVDDVERDVGVVAAGHDCNVREIHVFEEDFFPIEKGDVCSLIPAEGGGYFDDLFVSEGLKVPDLDHGVSDDLPSADFVLLAGVEVVLLLNQVVLLEQSVFRYFVIDFNGEGVGVEFVDGRGLRGCVALQQINLSLFRDLLDVDCGGVFGIGDQHSDFGFVVAFQLHQTHEYVVCDIDVIGS
jgi:hypothetical protein